MTDRKASTKLPQDGPPPEDPLPKAPRRAKTLKRDVAVHSAEHLFQAIAKLHAESPVESSRANAHQPSLATAEPPATADITSEPTPTIRIVSTAAVAMLQCDVRNRKVVLEELLRDFTLGDSDAARCVRLAAAKLTYEQLYPDSVHGKSGKRDPKSGSLPFWKYALGKVGGWKRSTISRWCSIGEGLFQAPYKLLLGTALANDLGRLEKVAALPEPAQLSVATKFALKLEREGRDGLERLSRCPSDAAEDLKPLSAMIGPPSHPKEVEVFKSSGAICILHDHILGVTDLGDKIRLTFLGTIRLRVPAMVITRFAAS